MADLYTDKIMGYPSAVWVGKKHQWSKVVGRHEPRRLRFSGRYRVCQRCGLVRFEDQRARCSRPRYLWADGRSVKAPLCVPGHLGKLGNVLVERDGIGVLVDGGHAVATEGPGLLRC